MYGMIFEDIFGSTVMDFGGDTVYVFIAMIVLSDEHGYIRITPNALARRIGKDVETIKTAVANLTEPDPDSNHPVYDGRRIVPISELTDGQENRGWFVVNKSSYRDMGSRYRRTELTNERSRKFREKNSNKNNDATQCNAMQREATQISHTYTDTDTDKTLKPLSGKTPDPTPKPEKINGTQVDEVINFLNAKTGKQYRSHNPDGSATATYRVVLAILKKGYSIQDCKMVIARQAREWGSDPKMAEYLRPKTLFAASNFENYIGKCVAAKESE